MAKPVKTAEMKRFLFERSFDEFGGGRAPANAAAAPAEPEVVEEPVVEITFSEAELAEARQESYREGHADGFREGHAEAMDTLERQLNDLLERLAPMVSNLGDVQRLSNERAQANMARMVQELMAKLMPIYTRTHGAEEAIAVVTDCLAELQDQGRLTIHLSEETADLLSDRLNKAAQRAGFEGQIRLLTDPELGPSDVRVDWGAGGAERRYESIRADVDAAIDRAVQRLEAEIGDGDSEPAPSTSQQETVSTPTIAGEETSPPADNTDTGLMPEKE